jgi:type IV secretion system protein VirD4
MAAITLGLEWYPHARLRRRRTGPPVVYSGERHLTLFGPNGSGKGAALEIPNLLRLGDKKHGGPLSIMSIDPKGQNRDVTARWRRTVSEVVEVEPFGPNSAGFNPLAALDPASPFFFEEAANISEALIPKPAQGDPFWPQSADSLTLGFTMGEVKDARAEGRVPTLENVRGMLTGDLTGHATRLFDSGDFQIASLVGRFLAENRTNDGIRSTADTATRWLLSAPMRADLAKDGIDFGRLKDRPTTVYVILPADKLETFSVWLRLIVASALNALYRRGGEGLRTLFMLGEFAQLGHLKPIMSALGQGRGYGIQLWPVLQDINQLRTIYGKDAANTFLGMSGATFAFTPNDPETADWMSRRSGETWSPDLTSSDDPQGRARNSWRGTRRRIYASDELYDIPGFHGLVWFAGQSRAVPVYAPPYFDPKGCPDLIGRFDPDPYHLKAA